MINEKSVNLKEYIRSIKDFPKKGIVFRDITILLKNNIAFKNAIDIFYKEFSDTEINKIVAIESRGFIFGGALAYKMGVGFVPVRKPQKLPWTTIREEYQLEYRVDTLEIHIDSISKGERILIIDDLLATGGTVAATCRLVERLGGIVAGIAFLIELSFLKGREKLKSYKIHSLIKYESEE